MLTRSVGERLYWRVRLFEQPPSSTRRDSAKHPVRKTKPNTKTTLKVFGPSTGYRFFWCSRLLSCGGRHLRCVSKTWVDVTCGFANACLSHKSRTYFGSWDALAENKEHICGGALFFRQTCPTYIRKPISSS